MITPQEAEDLVAKFSEHETQALDMLEERIDNGIRKVFEQGTPNTSFNVFGHEKEIPPKYVRKIICRYSPQWDIAYMPPIPNGYGHTSAGYFTLAKKDA